MSNGVDLATDGDHVFGLNRADRTILVPICTVIMLAIGSSWLFGGVNTFTRAIGGAVIVLSLAAAWWTMFFLRLVLSADSITIRNIRTRTIRYVDIEKVHPEYVGLVVRAYGRRFTALAVQRWNISLILRKRTLADFITDEIRRRVDLARSANPESH